MKSLYQVNRERDRQVVRDRRDSRREYLRPVTLFAQVSHVPQYFGRCLTGVHLLCQTCPMSDVNQEDVTHALEILGLTLPVTPETLAQTRRALLDTWNPARYANLTNNPKQYMQAYKKAEEMTSLIEAAHALLSAVLVPDDEAPC